MGRLVVLGVAVFFIGTSFIACGGGSQSMTSPIAAREVQISKLKKHMVSQRDELRKAGMDDGSGLLYQVTEAYMELKKICSEAELKSINAEMQPWRKP